MISGCVRTQAGVGIAGMPMVVMVRKAAVGPMAMVMIEVDPSATRHHGIQ
jgi:hypothetical protein